MCRRARTVAGGYPRHVILGFLAVPGGVEFGVQTARADGARERRPCQKNLARVLVPSHEQSHTKHINRMGWQ